MDRVLLVEDEPSLQLALGDSLADEGYAVKIAGTVSAALDALHGERPDLVLCDLRLPDGDGMTVLSEATRTLPDVPVVILTAYGSVASAIEAIRAGASEHLTKPFEEQQLLAMVRRYLEVGRLRRRVEELEGVTTRPLGNDPGFRRVVDLVRTVAASDTTVLLLGETGTGKEVLARFLHESSPRRRAPFVAVNCAALPEALLESELFGHERGAFTGAVKQRRGRFEEADKGTLFLDEIAETSPGVQAKLLRAIEHQRFERLGSSQPITVDVRIVAATKRDLAGEVAAGRFRDDLYYRLKVVPVKIPPLRERPGDIPLLAQAFARRFGRDAGRPFVLDAETLDVLLRYPFQGNVRELSHLVQRLSVTCPADVVRPEHLPDDIVPIPVPKPGLPVCAGGETLAERLDACERAILLEALERHAGHRGQIADALGISRKNLWEKLKQHGLGG